MRLHIMTTSSLPRRLLPLLLCWTIWFSLTTGVKANGPQDDRSTKPRNVILVTLDGLRWQELFNGADDSFINREFGGVRDVGEVKRRFSDPAHTVRREKLMPFFWKEIARHGVVYGNPDDESVVRVTNGLYFSYPGYNEILTGRADSRIDSNDKRYNSNVTVLEWLHQRPGFEGRVAGLCSWDVFPYIINDRRSHIPVNAGWQPLKVFSDNSRRDLLNELTQEIPRYWHNVRYDVYTFEGALEYLKLRKPRVLYVAFGETDDWAHEGRYDLYLDAARRTDRYIERLWETAQSMDDYAGCTSLIITTDHGRGDTRTDWKNHGKDTPGSDIIWIAIRGPDVSKHSSTVPGNYTQSQVAATVADLVNEDFHAAFPESGSPLPCLLDLQKSEN